MADGELISGLAMVYDADGGVPGDTRYLVRRLFGRTTCSLFEITHRGHRPKPEFEEFLAGLPVPAEVLHRNEQDIALRSTTAGLLPCVMAQVDGRWEPLVDRDQLAGCRGEVGRFRTVLDTALTDRIGR